MTDIAAIERASAIAWPAAETETVGEWVLSSGDGFSRRRNSAIPTGSLPDDPRQRVADVVAWYRERGILPRFRITSACDPEADEMLERSGWALEASTLVMSRPLCDAGSVEGIAESQTASDAWIDAELNALGLDRSLVGPWLETIKAVPQPAVFAMAIDEGESAGAGFGVVVDRLLASFEIAVVEHRRRRGHGRRLMAALHAFGLREGADDAFLQVMEDNSPAIALYEHLGYATLYRYWYRVHPA